MKIGEVGVETCKCLTNVFLFIEIQVYGDSCCMKHCTRVHLVRTMKCSYYQADTRDLLILNVLLTEFHKAYLTEMEIQLSD